MKTNAGYIYIAGQGKKIQKCLAKKYPSEIVEELLPWMGVKKFYIDPLGTSDVREKGRPFPKAVAEELRKGYPRCQHGCPGGSCITAELLFYRMLDKIGEMNEEFIKNWLGTHEKREETSCAKISKKPPMKAPIGSSEWKFMQYQRYKNGEPFDILLTDEDTSIFEDLCSFTNLPKDIIIDLLGSIPEISLLVRDRFPRIRFNSIRLQKGHISRRFGGELSEEEQRMVSGKPWRPRTEFENGEIVPWWV